MIVLCIFFLFEDLLYTVLSVLLAVSEVPPILAGSVLLPSSESFGICTYRIVYVQMYITLIMASYIVAVKLFCLSLHLRLY